MTDIFKRGITRKVFIVTLALLFSAAVVWMGMIFFFLPGFYKDYKATTLYENTDTVAHQLHNGTTGEAELLLTDFAKKNNANVQLVNNQTGELLFSWFPGKIIVNPDEQLNPAELQFRAENIKIDGQTYTLYVLGTLQPIDESIQALYLFLPYIIISVLIFAIISSIIYSKIISDPLIRLYRTAQKLSRLDFSEVSTVNSKDEIGELSKMLNELSRNLQRAMTGLQEVNNQLKDDIEKERINEAKRREFITTLSHDLKTPLTVIKGQLEGMLHNIGRYADRDKYLVETLKTADHMEELIQDMIRLVNLDDIDNLDHRIAVSLIPYIESLPEEFAHFIDEKELKMNLDIQTNDGRVDGEMVLIKQALHSVMMNAVVYAPEHAEVKITVTQNDQMVVVRIYNEGSHIDAEDINHVFDQFYRAEKSRNRYTGGSGIGLYIVRKIMQLHNGLATIANVENGVECSLYFPETIENVQNTIEDTGSTNVNGKQKNRKKKTNTILRRRKKADDEK
ncbi:sensor histidine kinase [Culicoidibacter larvae]|uniref:histidine kinase n=1 Tax=Culicoidibacter larvae TaxID=2579976 RepID=A0A5R8QAW9_9FIRM|nr:ATP-binding protein [Culicoidibacter larvae]TLG72030.1 HAMP domain-containing protein [Culicoidibacter larvae]